MEMKADMKRRGLANIRPDGERGWICNDPAGYMLNTWVPEKDPAMFPPKPDSTLAWTIADPDGFRLEVAGWGLPEHIANDCQGSNADCPGGAKG
jgi:hypothetical protein